MTFPLSGTVRGRPAGPLSHDARRILRVALLVLFADVLIRTAWLADDAYITFRTIDNLVSGYGPRWNVVERVQAYTHPLWMLLLTVPYQWTREAYLTPLAVSMALSLGAVWLFLSRLTSSTKTAVIGGTALIFSKAFVEYSTSGLENPLTHFLLVVFMILYFRRRPDDDRQLTMMCLTAGLLMLNRADTGLLVLPALVASWRGAGRRRVVRAMALGFAPLVLWELFSIVYYGFPFPNTAYAKLQTGAHASALMTQGLLYLMSAVAIDPVTPLAIALGLAAATVAADREQRPLALGVLAYLAYVVAIGGDFMAGRFLTAPLVCAVALFARARWRMPRGAVAGLVGAMALLGVFATTRPPITTGAGTFVYTLNEAINAAGVADERAYYYRSTGLLRWSRNEPLPQDVTEAGQQLRAHPDVIVAEAIGFLGYFAGPQAHIIDVDGLADPLLARLPAIPNWRIGHYVRNLPDGYLDTIKTSRNVIADAAIGEKYERLKLITQGPIWSRRRWRAILSENAGG